MLSPKAIAQRAAQACARLYDSPMRTSPPTPVSLAAVATRRAWGPSDSIRASGAPPAPETEASSRAAEGMLMQNDGVGRGAGR